MPGRLVVRRIPHLNPGGKNGQDTLFVTWRFQAFFATVPVEFADPLAADKTHRLVVLAESALWRVGQLRNRVSQPPLGQISQGRGHGRWQ